MRPPPSEELSARLLSAFFRFGRTPWHTAPADGLSRAETSVLERIQRANDHDRILRVADLSAILRVSSSTITQHLNNLQDQGFVERVQSKKDKRAVDLSLTEKGRAALASHWIELKENFNEFIAVIGEEKAQEMTDILAQAHEFFITKARSYENDDL